MPNKKVKLNKPIYVGFSILELAKLHMFKMHYDVMSVKFGDNARLLFTDTDSLCYQIQTNNLADDLLTIKDHLDTSKNPVDHPLYTIENKNVLGKFKDELFGKQMTEFVGLSSKVYAYSSCDGTENKKAKGITKNVISKQTNLDLYKSVLVDKKKHWISMNIIRSKNHDLYLSQDYKIGLNPFDDKRYILEDGIHTLAYGHHKIPL
jgi:hypothetical protein